MSLFFPLQSIATGFFYRQGALLIYESVPGSRFVSRPRNLIFLRPKKRSNSYTLKKKVDDFPVPSRDVTNQTVSGREKLNYSRPGESLVGDIPAEDRKILNLFTV